MTTVEREPLRPPRGLGAARSAGRDRRGVTPRTYRHPVNQALFGAAPVGGRLADRVTGFMGSWRFIGIQTAIVGVWLGANIILLSRPFDPFPFILLNLAFSTQAAYAAPLILLASNRASQRDRLTLEHASEEGDLGDAQNERLLTGNTEILASIAALEARILEMEQAIMAAFDVARSPGGSAKPKAPASRPEARRDGIWKMLFLMPDGKLPAVAPASAR